MQQDNRHVPDWLIERLALGELDAESAAEVRRRLAAEGRSPDDVMAAVAASNRALLEELPATPTTAAIRRRAATAAVRPVRRRALLWSAPLALAGGVAVVLMLRTPPTADPGRYVDGATGHYDGVKGPPLSLAPRLYVYRHGADGDHPLGDGARAARGDLVQLAYGSRGGGHGVLLSIDGAGKVTLHWPEKQDGPAPPLKVTGEIRLPSAYELDDAPAFERFFLVRAATPFPVATAVEAARALARQPSARRQALPLPAGFEQISLTLDKPHAGKKAPP